MLKEKNDMGTTLELPGYTMKEAGKILGLSERSAYRLAYAGQLQTYRDITGRLRIEYGEMHRIISKRAERN